MSDGVRPFGLTLLTRPLVCEDGDRVVWEGPASSSEDPLDDVAAGMLVRATAGEELALPACLLRLLYVTVDCLRRSEERSILLEHLRF